MLNWNGTTRRNWLKATGWGVASTLVGSGAWSRAMAEVIAADAATVPARKQGAFRLAHMTDFHVQESLGGARGMAACLQHAQSMRDKPDLILNTGDSIMDSMKRDEAATAEQWNIWTKTLKENNAIPIKHGLGNHDVWGWDRAKSKTTGNEPRFGKKWALDVLGLDKPYYAFEQAGWKFIMLDSLVWAEAASGNFAARLDDEQWAWFESEVKSTDAKTPICVASHVPIVSGAVLLDTGAIGGTPEEPALVPRRVHVDVKRFGDLFRSVPNVKLCLSGHLHQIDRVDYYGTTFLSNPAVCGNWWKGKHVGRFGPQYTVIDLMPNGTFEHRYVSYGWKEETETSASS